jgi:hypothetical protein
MEENITQDRSRAEVPLNEPHFDEEATLLSARPVVPLEEVKAEEGSRRRLVFVFSILIALAAGALGGTLLYKYQKSAPAVQTATPVDEQASGQTAAVADAGGATIDLHSNALSATNEKAPETVAPETADRSGSTSAKSSTQTAPPAVDRPAIRDDDAESRGEDQSARDNGDDSEREMRREERKEARKEARRRGRETQREARRSRDTSDDLLRIREIFEGAPKP